MHILTLVAAVASDGESWEVLAEGCAADYTGNFRDIARRLISTCQRQPRNEEEEFRDDEVRKSYSADKHTFDYILHTGTMLMFLSLSDENSTTRESFRYLEVIKNVVLSAVRDYTTDYFHLGSGALPASSNGNGWQQHSPHADKERLAYAAVVRGAFRSAVMQYLRETATNMSFPEDDVELGGKGGGATLRVDFHRSTSTASSSGTEQENSPSVLEEPFMDMTLSSTRRINSDSSIRPQATSLVGTPSTTAMATTAVGLLPPPPDDLRSRKLCNSYDSGLQLRRRGSGLVVGDGIPPPPGPADWTGGPRRRASVRISGLRVRRSRDEMSAFDDNDEEDSSSAGSSPAVLPDTVQMKVRRDADEEDRKAHAAILLPMDYSGMAEEGSYGESLLKAMDVQVKNALQTQVSIAESVDALLTVLHMFRDTLKEIPLPPPTSVDLKQALKDAQRETIVVNGKTFKGDAEGLEREMRRHVEPFASSETAQLLCQDIMRASSRTASGGDSYSIATSLLCRRGNLLTPAQVESSPITITISPEGVVNILAENVYALHRNMMMDVDEAEMNGGGKSSGHQRKASKSKIMDFLGGGKKQQEPQGVANGTVGSADNPEAAEGGADLVLTTVLEVRLSILERSSSRRLRIRSGEVEKCPPQYLALGSGEPDVNGAYTVKGFKNRAPWYENPDGVQLVKDVVTSATGLMGSPGLLARMESSPSKASASQQPCWTIATPSGSGSTHRVYYVQRGSVSLLPPCEGWEAMHEDVRQPPPTLMPNFSAANRRPSSQVVRRGTHSFGDDASPRDSMRRDSLAKAAGAITAALSSAAHQQPPQQQQQQQGGSSSNTSSGRGFRAIPRFF